MNIVIVEDEVMIARRIEQFTRTILQEKVTQISHFLSLEEAQIYMDTTTPDVLLLDLNLDDRCGFDLLKNIKGQAFETIVISANTNKALEAFEYGVLDFLGKPLCIERLAKAFSRLEQKKVKEIPTNAFITIKKYGKIEKLAINSIFYIKAAKHYSELFTENGQTHIYDKNLEQLLHNVKGDFVRVHKSYAISFKRINTLHRFPGGKYSLELENGEKIPLGRSYYPYILSKLA